MNADGKNPIRLTDGPRRKEDPDWSPDGQKIAFTVNPDWKKEELLDHIAVMDADGNNRVMHEDHGREPSWSPDGGEIAFTSWRDDWNWDIYVIGADGQGLKRVTHDLAYKSRPAFSPDGGRIAYMSEHEGFNHIYVVGADGRKSQEAYAQSRASLAPRMVSRWTNDRILDLGRYLGWIFNDSLDDRRWKIS